jgi:lipopolysaccharide export system protein LptC
MSLTPISPSGAAPRQPHRPRERMVGEARRLRRPPTRGGLLRRRILITVTKFVLPVFALALLGTIALWPELDRATNVARVALHRLTGDVDGAEVIDARYHGVDDQGRPYTLTAATARQEGPEKFSLTNPHGDMTLQNGTWVEMRSKLGAFVQHANLLDMWQDVVMYRDDGTTLYTQSISMDLKNGAAAGSQPVHAEGPFGQLDAQGFALTDKGSVVQFTGPARLVLNNGGKP